MPLKPVANPVLTVVPGFVRYPPELAYPPVSETSEPAVVLREEGASRLAWFAGDVERTYWLTGHTDLLRLIDNTIRWVTRDERMVSVAGPGFIETVLLGDRAGLRRAPAQLLERECVSWLDAECGAAGAAAREHEAAGRSAREGR